MLKETKPGRFYPTRKQTVKDRRVKNVGRIAICEKCEQFDGINCRIIGCLGCLKTKTKCPLKKW